MVSQIIKKRYGPIGIDIGAHSVKLVQFNADQTKLLDAAKWDFPIRYNDQCKINDTSDRTESLRSSNNNADNLGDAVSNGNGKGSPDKPSHENRLGGGSFPNAMHEDDNHDAILQQRNALLIDALRQARESRNFRGRDVTVCLGNRDLFLQNIRIPKMEGANTQQLVQREIAGRIPFPITDAEIRYVEAGDVRQGDSMMREVIVLVCDRTVLHANLDTIIKAGLRPIAVDVEPAALLRSYESQFRRAEDLQQRAIFVHIGYSNTIVVIAEGEQVLFAKYLDVNGQQMDDAVSNHLGMSVANASALRRHNGDRRADQRDPEIAKGVADSIRPVVEHLAGELSKCIRYHAVTFRGRSLDRLILGGGEASQALLDSLSKSFDMKCMLGDPLRGFQATTEAGHAAFSGCPAQWDVAAGLAMRSLN